MGVRGIQGGIIATVRENVKGTNTKKNPFLWTPRTGTANFKRVGSYID